MRTARDLGSSPRRLGKRCRHTFVLKEITPAARTALRPLSPTVSFYNLRRITLPRSPRELAAELGRQLRSLSFQGEVASRPFVCPQGSQQIPRLLQKARVLKKPLITSQSLTTPITPGEAWRRGDCRSIHYASGTCSVEAESTPGHEVLYLVSR